MSDIEVQNQNNKIEEFKKHIKRAIFLNAHEEQYFNAVPDSVFEKILEKNFDDNLEFAKRVLMNKFDDIEKIDKQKTAAQHKKITNLGIATDSLLKSIQNKEQIVFITDFDNDGSLAQSIINTYLKIDTDAAKNTVVEYAQALGQERGISLAIVEKIIKNKGIDTSKPFTIVTADNGINSRSAQLAIQTKYENCKLIITDHHMPDTDSVVLENDKTIIVNPKYEPTPFFEQNNISGAHTMGVLLKSLLEARFEPNMLNMIYSNELKVIDKLCAVSNMLDYVDTAPADKPFEQYIIKQFLELQPLLNVNTSISKLITGEVSLDAIKAIKDKINDFDADVVYEATKEIHRQNVVAKALLSMYEQYEKLPSFEKKEKTAKTIAQDLVLALDANETYDFSKGVNNNYIEQLRPIIFSLSADEQKSPYLEELKDLAVNVFKSVRMQEGKIIREIRRGDVITSIRGKNSVINYADEHILSIFNRRFLIKAYNEQNNGMMITLDSIGKERVSGSLRCLYDASEIFLQKASLEKKLDVKIEVLGHERAAGFIVTAKNGTEITNETLEKINEFIDKRIEKLAKKQRKTHDELILIDLATISTLDKINKVVRGNVAHFERIPAAIKLNKDTVVTEAKTDKQLTLEEIVSQRRYGYIPIKTSFADEAVIVPVEALRSVVENDYEDYLSLNYLDGGIYLVDKVVKANEVKSVIDITAKNTQTELIAEHFEKYYKDNDVVHMTRTDIMNQPVFKYSDYGVQNFNKAENYIINILDKSADCDSLTVLDVEANGLGKAKLINIGTMTYSIDEASGKRVNLKEFSDGLFETRNGINYYLNAEEIKELQKLSTKNFENLSVNEKSNVLIKSNGNRKTYYIVPENKKNKPRGKKLGGLKYEVVNNFAYDDENTVVYNRQIKAEARNFLVKGDDVRVPQEMTNLTGLTTDLTRRFGKNIEEVDAKIAHLFAKEPSIVGAHNTPYDFGIISANLPLTFQVMTGRVKNEQEVLEKINAYASDDEKLTKLNTKVQLFDTARLAKEQKFAYDNTDVAEIEGVPELKGIYFYNSPFSDYCLTKFLIDDKKEGHYPDRTGRYLLKRSIDDLGIVSYSVIDKKENSSFSIQFNEEQKAEVQERIQQKFELYNADVGGGIVSKHNNDIICSVLQKGEAAVTKDTMSLLALLKNKKMPDVAIKYSVEKIYEQLIVRNILLSDEKFDIKHVEINENKYPSLVRFKDELLSFEDNYMFNRTPDDNLANFMLVQNDKRSKKEEDYLLPSKELSNYVIEFLNINKDIQNKFSDAWVYKRVLEFLNKPQSNITNNFLELINYHTQLPENIIEKACKDISDFAKKFKLKSVHFGETHVNGIVNLPDEHGNYPDAQSDTTLESIINFLSLAQNNSYDRFNSSINVSEFEQNIVDASLIAAKAINATPAVNSHSFKQLENISERDYDNSELVQKVVDKVDEMTTQIDESVLKINLPILPTDSSIYMATKPGICIDKEQLDEDIKTLNKVVSFAVMHNNMKNMSLSESAFEALNDMFEENVKFIEEAKEDLAKRYGCISFSRRDYYAKQLIDLVDDALKYADSTSTVEKALKKFTSAPIRKSLDTEGVKIVKAVFNECVSKYAQYHASNSSNDKYTDFKIVAGQLEDAIDALEQLKESTPSSLEKYIKGESVGITQQSKSLFDDAFLGTLSEITKTTPSKTFLQSPTTYVATAIDERVQENGLYLVDYSYKQDELEKTKKKTKRLHP